MAKHLPVGRIKSGKSVCAITYKGLFINYVIAIGGGGGLPKKLFLQRRGEGGVTEKIIFTLCNVKGGGC